MKMMAKERAWLRKFLFSNEPANPESSENRL